MEKSRRVGWSRVERAGERDGAEQGRAGWSKTLVASVDIYGSVACFLNILLVCLRPMCCLVSSSHRMLPVYVTLILNLVEAER